MFRLSKKGSVEYLEADVLRASDFLVHAFCTRRGGVSEGNFSSLNFSVREGDTRENVRRNWEIVAAAFNLQVENFLVVNQVHDDRILIIDRPHFDFERHRMASYDAIITNQPGIALAIKTADCVPIFFFDRVKRIIGVAHAGWRGTSLNIAAKVVGALRETFSCDTSALAAVIGPSIGQCCYQVDGRVFGAMEAGNYRQDIFSPCSSPGRWMLNLPLANTFQIIGGGVLPENIHVAGHCTSCQRDTFFSHRGEKGNTGRQLNFIMLRGGNKDGF